jgi:hypothetical protein
MTPEGKTKAMIDKWLKAKFPTGWWFKPVSMGYGKHGIPDYVCCIPKVITQDMVGNRIGMFVGIEAKSLRGECTDRQYETLGQILDADGTIGIVYGTETKGLEELAFLERRLK